MTDDEECTIEMVDLDKDFNASAARLIELKANRHVDDIPITDDYWKALKKHQTSHGRKS
jgi:hypothetical protein